MKKWTTLQRIEIHKVKLKKAIVMTTPRLISFLVLLPLCACQSHKAYRFYPYGKDQTFVFVDGYGDHTYIHDYPIPQAFCSTPGRPLIAQVITKDNARAYWGNGAPGAWVNQPQQQDPDGSWRMLGATWFLPTVGNYAGNPSAGSSGVPGAVPGKPLPYTLAWPQLTLGETKVIETQYFDHGHWGSQYKGDLTCWNEKNAPSTHGYTTWISVFVLDHVSTPLYTGIAEKAKYYEVSPDICTTLEDCKRAEAEKKIFPEVWYFGPGEIGPLWIAGIGFADSKAVAIRIQ